MGSSTEPNIGQEIIGPESTAPELVAPEVIVPGESSGFYVDKRLPIRDLSRSAESVSYSAYAITLVAGLNAGWFGALLPALAKSQNLPLEEAGILASAIAGGGFVALAASGKIIARLHDLKTTLLASAMAALGFSGLGLASGLPALTACAFCYGLGVGLNSISSHIIFPRYFPNKVASALSKLNTFYGIGALSGPMIALELANLNISYNWVFLGAGTYTALITAYLLYSKQKYGIDPAPLKTSASEAHGLSAADSKKALIALLSHPLLIGLAVINLLYVGVESTLGTWIYSFVQRADHFDGNMASTSMSLLWLGLTLGRVVSTRACLKINPKYVTMTAMLILVTALFMVASIHINCWVTLLMVLVIGFGLGPIFPTVIAQSATRFPKDSSLTTAIIISAGCVGGMLLPWVGGKTLVGLGANNFMLLTAATAALLPLLLGLTLFPLKAEMGPKS